jgi:hypothetical protein
MSSEIIDNASAAAAQPADAAPDVREQRRQEIMKSPDYWNDGPKTRALRDEMKRITSDPSVVAQQDQRKTEAEAKLSPAEQRIKKANANPALWDPKHPDHEAARKELREAVAAGATPEEQQAMKDAPLEEHRSAFGLTAPDEWVLPKANQEEYEQEYGGHEQDFLLAARQHGLDSKLVGELRDVGIRIAIEAEGRPVSDETWAVMEKRFAGRITASQFKALKAWWRGSVEKGA